MRRKRETGATNSVEPSVCRRSVLYDSRGGHAEFMSATVRPAPPLPQGNHSRPGCQIPGRFLFDIAFAFRVNGTVGVSPVQPLSRSCWSNLVVRVARTRARWNSRFHGPTRSIKAAVDACQAAAAPTT
ncbi:hypothetical protein F01_400055 [Burkholderia cenocepacia]|nr:hypothetical protein F01_400055 [Burkholderia cenocepacia]